MTKRAVTLSSRSRRAHGRNGFRAKIVARAPQQYLARARPPPNRFHPRNGFRAKIVPRAPRQDRASARGVTNRFHPRNGFRTKTLPPRSPPDQDPARSNREPSKNTRGTVFARIS